MSLLENLPVDIHTPNHQEEELVQVLFGDGDNHDVEKASHHRPTNHSAPKSHEFLRILEEGLAIVALFLFFSSPYVTNHIKAFPYISSEILENIVKIILILIFFSIIKRHCL